LDIRFQPVIDIGTDIVVRVEAFCAIKVSVEGVEGTAAFVKHAEESGLIRGLTESVLARTLSEWRKLTNGPAVSINVSQANLDENDFCDRIEAALASCELEGESLTLELPEGIELMADGPSLDMLRRLKKRGVRISVDGFGPEHSMFSYIELERICARELKIDAHFLATLGVSRRATLASMVALCRNGNMDAVIKNVETEEQLELARGLGCNRAQGFLIAHPMDSAALEAWLQERTVIPARRPEVPQPEEQPAAPAGERRTVLDKLFRKR
jgi:EAL domain-containing protein (putative c-di-GMP-specific phosphodiesterase class I)